MDQLLLDSQMTGGQVTGINSSQNNSMSVRTINLKKEISSLDQEILILQNSLKEAIQRKMHNWLY